MQDGHGDSPPRRGVHRRLKRKGTDEVKNETYIPSFATVAECLSRLPKGIDSNEGFKAFWDGAIAAYEENERRKAEGRRRLAAEAKAMKTFVSYFSHGGGAVKYLNGKRDFILRKYILNSGNKAEKALCPTCGKPTAFISASVVGECPTHVAYNLGKLVEIVYGCEKCENHVSTRFYAKGYEVHDTFRAHLRENQQRMLHEGVCIVREFVSHSQFFIDGHKAKKDGKVGPFTTWAVKEDKV